MKLLVDSVFPRTIEHLPNPQGIQIIRLESAVPDDDLAKHAHALGCGGVALVGHEMLSDTTLVGSSRALGIALVCSVSEDPIQAESNLRSALPHLPELMASRRGGGWWLYRGGRLVVADL